ncbi:MAG: chemotaxis protein CheX [Gemmata sp.]
MDRDHPPGAALVIEAFSAATVTAFEELCRTPVTPGAPAVGRSRPLPNVVTAEIDLRRAAPGRLVVAFPRPVLHALAARFLPDDVSVTPDIADDAAGEFANVIAGQAKTMLKGTVYHFNLSTPQPASAAPADGPDFLTLPFDCDAGAFSVCVHLPPCEESGTAA